MDDDPQIANRANMRDQLMITRRDRRDRFAAASLAGLRARSGELWASAEVAEIAVSDALALLQALDKYA